jgi:hypothetical protein
MWGMQIFERPKLEPEDNVELLYKRCDKNIEDVIEEYKCKIANAPKSDYWRKCLKIAKQMKNKKEEPKQENDYTALLQPVGTKQEPCDNCNNDVCCCTIKKQETLEEAAEKYANLYYDKNSELISVITESIEWSNRNHNFIAGAKWQQEQDKKMYSKEEVIKFGQWLTLFDNLRNENKYVIKQLLKQFKNKTL